jgi:undecaprenyl-diphosphatase
MEMNYWHAVIYGIIQGLSEFLPVSSSAHLAVLPHFMHIEDPGVLFDLSMHVGTAIAIVVYFKSQVKSLLRESVGIALMRRAHSPERNFALNSIVSTFTTFALAAVLKGFALTHGRSMELIAFNLFFFGILMVVADHLMKASDEMMMNQFRPKIAVAIGLIQAFAIFPGVSRSGGTLTMARLMGLSRDEAARYSFLLSVPVIAAGFILDLPDFFNGNTRFDIGECLMGMGVSFFVGLATIHFFLKVIKKMGLAPFAIYRIAIAAFIASVILGNQ